MKRPHVRNEGYRADIDGLRAVAIVPVLLYHGGFRFATGGYVGVDVFFVVSGYLIASLILTQVAAGKFSLLNFYERRVRRILPALLTVAASCSVAAAVLFLPDALRRYGASLFATAFSASNVFFWLETGYFTADAALKPLLHTWSLAVEEQFYLVVPLLLTFGIRHRPRHLAAWTAALLVISLVASEWAAQRSPSAAFYLTPFRAWELALGVFLALGLVPSPRQTRVRGAAAWIGLALIGWCVSAYSWETQFPGLAAFGPCAGAALVIWSGAGGDTRVKRLLSWRPLVFVGLVSYSLYLWHWPLLSFARYLAVRDLTISETIAVLSGSFLLAALSWRFVEQPFRRDGTVGRPVLFASAIAASVAIAAFGLTAFLASGWPGRQDAESLRLAAGAQNRNPRSDECSFLGAKEIRAGLACRLGSASGESPSFAVWGDSQADALMPAFDRLAAAHGVTGIYLGRVGCPPLLGVERPDTDYHCRDYNEAALAAIREANVPTIVMVARWPYYTREPTYGQESRTRVVISQGGTQRPDVRDNEQVLADGLRRTLESLQGRSVVVVSEIPEIGYYVPEVTARMHFLGKAFDIRPTRSAHEERQRKIRTMLDELESKYRFSQLRLDRSLCSPLRCEVQARGAAHEPLYSDDNHLSVVGANYVSADLEPMFERLAPAQHARPANVRSPEPR